MTNQRRNLMTGAIAGVLVTVPLAALLYLGKQLADLPMVAFDLLERLTRFQLFGRLVSASIDVMVRIFSQLPGVAIDQASKTFEEFSAVVLFLIIGAIVGAIYVRAMSSIRRNAGLTVGLIAWVLSLGIEIGSPSAHFALDILWLLVLTMVWGYALTWSVDRLLTPAQSSSQAPAQPEVIDTGRRQFLIQFSGGALIVTVAAFGLGKLLGRSTPTGAGEAIASIPTATGQAPTGAATQQGTTAASGTFVAVPGTRPEITPNDQFYRVDVNIGPGPSVDQTSWKLAVGGLVSTALSLSYDDLTKLPATHQYATLECISNPVGGDLISTTQFTGVKLGDLLKQAGLKDGVKEIKFTCTDGYTETLPLESAMDERTLLAYGMNGKALPSEHGFPLRLYTPNRYGMKNPKWITTVEAIGDAYDGYWEVDGGWDKQAIVKSTSVIDKVSSEPADNGAYPVGGIAFAGARGISTVELSMDGGDWKPAQLKAPIAPLTWTLWRYDVKAPKGHHALAVRCTDGRGAAQISDEAPLHPDGASGYYSIEFDV